jgi:hypothetical protein
LVAHGPSELICTTVSGGVKGEVVHVGEKIDDAPEHSQANRRLKAARTGRIPPHGSALQVVAVVMKSHAILRRITVRQALPSQPTRIAILPKRWDYRADLSFNR